MKVDNITPVEGNLITTLIALEKKASKIELPNDVKDKFEQPAYKIRRVSEKSLFKVGQVVLIHHSLNGTPFMVNDMKYIIIPEFEVKAIVG